MSFAGVDVDVHVVVDVVGFEGIQRQKSQYVHVHVHVNVHARDKLRKGYEDTNCLPADRDSNARGCLSACTRNQNIGIEPSRHTTPHSFAVHGAKACES